MLLHGCHPCARADMFIFYDLLPTAAELAGLDRTKWPDTDGLSAVPIFEASVADTTTNLRLSVKSPKRFLYYEFCHNGMVNGLLPQSYASGWGQAVRFDDNLTAGETHWKAIAVNSNYSNVLLYNLTVSCVGFSRYLYAGVLTIIFDAG
eukprot:SAG31_NODE_849_length_11529_cov_3.342257_12_plen_149_part_00